VRGCRFKFFTLILMLYGLFLPLVFAANYTKAEYKIDSFITEKITKTNTNQTVRVIIKFKKLDGVTTVNTINSVKESIIKEKGKIKRQFSIINGVVAEVPVSKLYKLASNPLVERIEYDHKVKAFLNESVPLINADDVWNMILAGENITGQGEAVCVIDTGVNYSNSFFGGGFGPNYTVIAGYDFVNNDSDPMDDNRHGTHVAGIIASINSVYRGVAPGAKIVAIKALDSNGSGNFSDIIAGIDWCVTNASLYILVLHSITTTHTAILTFQLLPQL